MSNNEKPEKNIGCIILFVIANYSCKRFRSSLSYLMRFDTIADRYDHIKVCIRPTQNEVACREQLIPLFNR